MELEEQLFTPFCALRHALVGDEAFSIAFGTLEELLCLIRASGDV
jgi:hypothetical protein